MKIKLVSKITWLIISFLFVMNMMQAQVVIRAGVIISKQDFQNGNLNQNVDSKLGADIALITEFPAGSVVRISPELHWMQKGAKIEDLDRSVGQAIKTFNYLELPVLVKVHIGEPNGVFLFGGPSVGYLLGGTDKDGDGDRNDIDLDFYKRAEWGAHFGGGATFGPVNLDVRYILGLSNINNDDTDLEVTNRGFGAGLSVMF
jgi:hypothetical protein